MTALQVKDFPADLYDGLRSCAIASDRSISQQTVHIIREYLEAFNRKSGLMDVGVAPSEQFDKHAPTNYAQAQAKMRDAQGAEERREARKRLFSCIDALPKFEVPKGFPDAVELVHEGREERMNSIVPDLNDYLKDDLKDGK